MRTPSHPAAIALLKEVGKPVAGPSANKSGPVTATTAQHVADSLTGQDAVNLAKSFDERVGITGLILTRADGDGRG